MTAALPVDLREAIALGIARGYYTHTCVEEIEPLVAAALARARAEGAREALTAAADDMAERIRELREAREIPAYIGGLGEAEHNIRLAARAAGVATAPTEPAEVCVPKMAGAHDWQPVYDSPTLYCQWCRSTKPDPDRAAPSGVAPADTPEEN